MTEPVLTPENAAPASAGVDSRALWREEIRALVKLGTPVVFTQLAQMAIGTTDILMVGALGKEALAAVALTLAVYYTLWGLGSGVTGAIAPMIAHILGARANDVIGVRTTIRMGLWAVILMAVPLDAILAFSPDILKLIGEPAALADMGGPFAHVLTIGLPFGLTFMALRGYVLALKKPQTTLYVISGAIFVNAFLDYALIFGHFGAPRLGIMGSAIASVTAYMFECLSLLAIIFVTEDLRRYRMFRRFDMPDWGKLTEIFKLGVPMGLSWVFEILFFNTGALVMGYFGAAALAAHQVALNFISILFMVPMGIGMASSVRIGLAVGAGNADGVRRAGLTALGLGAILNGTLALLLAIFPRTVAGLYFDESTPENADLLNQAVVFLRAAAAFEIFDALQAIAIQSLRGLKDTKVPMVITGIAYWVIGFPASLFLSFYTPLKGLGVWIAFIISLVFVAAMLLVRFAYKSGVWRRA